MDQRLTIVDILYIFHQEGEYLSTMPGCKQSRKIRRIVTGVMTLVFLLLFVAPVGAVKVVRKSGQRVAEKNKTKTLRQNHPVGDTTGTSIRSLLNDVRSRKNRGADSLDTWIDRDGDGVNDHLKKRALPAKENPPEIAPTRQDSAKSPKTRTPAAKKAKKTGDNPPGKKRR